MEQKLLCATLAAALFAIAASAPASAYSVVAAAKNSDGSPRFADPDANFDQQFDDWQNGRSPGASWLGDHARNDPLPTDRGSQTLAIHRNRHDNTCIDCRSKLVDGVWVVRHDNDDADADPAPSR